MNEEISKMIPKKQDETFIFSTSKCVHLFCVFKRRRRRRREEEEKEDERFRW